MIRRISLLFALVFSTNIFASELADGLAFQQKKDYPQAMQIFSKLATEGDMRAQEELADMYWYGDGMAVDLQKAQYWFTKAAQLGSSKAKASLNVMHARLDRRQEISYYTTQFDGGKLQFENSGCVKPIIPGVSTTNSEIKKVTTEINAWSACYTDYIQTISAAPQGVAMIPKDLMTIMSDEDLGKAAVTIDRKVANIVAQAKLIAEEVNSKIDAWKKDTEAYVIKANGGKAGMSLEEFEIFQRNIRTQLEMYRNSKEFVQPTRNPTTTK